MFLFVTLNNDVMPNILMGPIFYVESICNENC